MSKIREKSACKGVKFETDVHEEFDVQSLPFQNLHKAHPMRVEWEKANPNKDWSDDEGRNDLAMRPASKDLSGHGRADSLSYSKLVRATAVAVHKGDAVDDVRGFIEGESGRLFQNLVFVIGLDTKTFAESVESVSKAVDMFVDDVTAEVPEAKPSGGGGKTQAEVRAEVEAEIAEKHEALKDEARAFVQRAASKQGVAGVSFPTGVSMDMLGEVYLEVKVKFESDKTKAGKEALQALETWALPFQSIWAFDADVTEHETLEAAD